MDERADRGEFYPGGDRSGGAPAPQQSDKVDRVNVGEIGESYTLEEVKKKVNQIVRVIAPAAVCLALAVVRLLSYAATAPLKDIPNTAPVVTNEEDSVALATLGTATNSLLSRMSAGMSELRSDMNTASNKLVSAISESIAAESNRVESTYAKRSEIPAAPDLAPYALKSELPRDYLTEGDITNFATRAWINSQNYAREGTVYTRLDAQDLAIDAATNAQNAAIAATGNRVTAATNRLWQAVGSESNRLDSATNEVWQSALRADETLQREIDTLRIVAADSNAVTRLVTQDGTIWQDATGTVWQVQDSLGPWQATTSSVQFVRWEDLSTEEYDLWKIYFSVDGTNAEGYAASPAGLTSYTLPAGEWEYSGLSVYGDFKVTFVRPTIPGGATNGVNRVAYTNDLATATKGVMGEVDERFNQWGEMGTVFAATRLVDQTGGGHGDVTASDVWQIARSATNYTDRGFAAGTNYTDAVAAEFSDGTRTVSYSGYSDTSGFASSAGSLIGDGTTYNAASLIRESTNAAIAVAARKQDALPYPTNAIPYAAISGAPPEMGALDKMWEFQLSGYGETAKARGRIIGVSGTTAMVYCQLHDTSNIEWAGFNTYYLFSMIIEFNSDAYTILSSVADGSSFSNVVATLYFADAYSIMTGYKPSTTEIEYNTVLFKAVR